VASLEIDDEQPELLSELAEVCVRDDDPRAAQQYLEELSRMTPYQPEVLHNLAVCHFMQNDWKEGIRYCKEALSVDARYLPAMHKLAIAHMTNENWAEAKWAIEEGLRIEPENEQFVKLSRQLRANHISNIVSHALKPVKSVGRQITRLFQRSHSTSDN